MFFKNSTLFRLSENSTKDLLALAADIDGIEYALEKKKFTPCGSLELSSSGFVSPFGWDGEVYSHQVGSCLLFCLGREDKIMPAAAINQAVARKVQALETRRAKPIGGRERRKIKEEVIHDLLPKAMTRPSCIHGYLDFSNGFIVIDTASRKAADLVITSLREALDSMPCAGAQPEENTARLYTDWLAGGEMPKGWALGDEVELKDPSDHGATVKARHQELDSDEIREHLRAGKEVSRLAIVVGDRVSFVLDQELTIRKLKFLDEVLEDVANTEPDSMQAELDARFALATLELKPILEQIATTFAWERPQSRGDA